MAIILGMPPLLLKVFRKKGTYDMCLFVRAFTLVEVVVSMLVVSMLLSLQVPFFDKQNQEHRFDDFYEMRNELIGLNEALMHVNQEGLWVNEQLIFELKPNETITIDLLLNVIVISFQLGTGAHYEMVLPRL